MMIVILRLRRFGRSFGPAQILWPKLWPSPDPLAEVSKTENLQGLACSPPFGIRHFHMHFEHDLAVSKRWV
jgi:hypothetical protein